MPTHTHDKLQAILGNFEPFDVEMKEGTRRRREYDEERLRELAAELARLQEALEKQVQIRVDMNQDLQSWMMTQVKEMTGRLSLRSHTTDMPLCDVEARMCCTFRFHATHEMSDGGAFALAPGE